MIDLVYPIGLGSIWENNELRYSIRSFVKYFNQLGKIFIVGEKPDFLKWNNPKLIHVECNDIYRHNKDRNIIAKVLKICQRNDISDDFIRASDDQILLKNVSIDDFYPKYLIDLSGKEFKRNNRWFKRLEYEARELIREGKSAFFYDSHYPVIYNKKSFIDIMSKTLDSDNYTINTYYFNNILDEHYKLGNIKSTFQIPVISMQEFLTEIKGKTFLGYNNKGLREPSVLKLWLQNEFREKSEFEK